MMKNRSKTMRDTNDSQKQVSSQGGGFFDGMVLGMVLGAAGYFIFGTPEGNKVKGEILKELKKQWQDLDIKPETVKQTGEKIVNKAKQLKAQVEENLPVVQEKIQEELQQLEKTTEAARKQADAMEKQLQQTASRIEKKFFMRKGRSLGK